MRVCAAHTITVIIFSRGRAFHTTRSPIIIIIHHRSIYSSSFSFPLSLLAGPSPLPLPLLSSLPPRPPRPLPPLPLPRSPRPLPPRPPPRGSAGPAVLAHGDGRLPLLLLLLEEEEEEVVADDGGLVAPPRPPRPPRGGPPRPRPRRRGRGGKVPRWSIRGGDAFLARAPPSRRWSAAVSRWSRSRCLLCFTSSQC